MDLNVTTTKSSWVFWILFALTGALLLLQSPWVEILLGVIVIFIGIHRLAWELERNRTGKEKESVQEALSEIMECLREEWEHVKEVESRYENRFFQMDKRRADLEERVATLQKETDNKIENNYRELVRRILELDNKMNDVARAFLTKPPRSGRKKA
ncbi:MAG: hypothetical protein ISS93_03715 [Candidatus Aenigmarchaeota archaeon]|nr:hypothetical protein [Candidatus Aenigmarchaeota archaeon]